MTADWEDVVRAGWRRGQALGAVGPGPVDDHLDHARGLAAALPAGAEAGLDLGSGAGIPGLALAGLRPDMRWVLLDSARRRTLLVADVIAAAGWGPRVEVVHHRAEIAGREAAYRQRFDVVTARLFGPPAVTAECAAPFVRAGGRLLVTDPPLDDDLRWSADGLALLGLGLELGDRLRHPAIQILERRGPLDDRFPRQPGVAARRPLW